MKKPLTVSLITVCYNSASTLEETLQSVSAQDYPHIEYIVIDGASTDGSLDILSRYKSKIQQLVSEPDQGIYDAMNKGIALATGDIIGLLNADDLYANNNVISKIVSTFHQENIQACYGDLIYFSDKAKEKVYRYWLSNAFEKGSFAKGWSPAHPTFFVRREIYQKYGLFDLTMKMGNDIELMMRLLEKQSIQSQYIPEILVKMRLGGASNKALKNIILQNKCILSAAKKLEIPISPLTFILHKVLNRVSQFVFKRRACYDVK